LTRKILFYIRATTLAPQTIANVGFRVSVRARKQPSGDPEHGATIIEAEEAAVFRAMSRRAKRVVIVADSSKVGMTSAAVICPAGDIDMQVVIV
jgi:DeoR/GlpR family transcriptional regulator of sugar metabolism